tara:strand:- start:624 stop:821 length:198 start_codon:yes stop_codon:yes gene_type:complete
MILNKQNEINTATIISINSIYFPLLLELPVTLPTILLALFPAWLKHSTTNIIEKIAPVSIRKSLK